MNYKIFFFAMFFIVSNSFVSNKMLNRTSLIDGESNPNQPIVDYIEFLVSVNNNKLRVAPTLKFRDYLTMVYENGVVSNQVGFKMKWQCVLDEHPDTSKVMLLPQLPNQLMNTVVVAESIDTLGTDYMRTVYFSPVFETNNKGIYAFHVSTVSVQIFHGYRDDYIDRWFVRYRILDDTIEWLNCYGRTVMPFGDDPEKVDCQW